jgi:Mrp family chromosome partitioning ATPase
MSSKVYDGTTPWTVMGQLRHWRGPKKERANGHDGVLAGRDRGRPAVELDPEEPARREEIQLVQRAFFRPGGEARRAVLFTGVEEDNGCARMCVRAGRMLARLLPQSICIVDANVRAPSLHQFVGSDNREGFTTAVREPGSGPKLALPWASDNLWILPSGSSSASDPDLLLTADRARASLQALSARFDHLVVNAPPLNLYSESLALGQLVDGVVLVVEANVTRREIVRNAKTLLEDLDIPLLGAVLNDRRFPIPDALYRRL